jgi:hypothetical protein
MVCSVVITPFSPLIDKILNHCFDYIPVRVLLNGLSLQCLPCHPMWSYRTVSKLEWPTGIKGFSAVSVQMLSLRQTLTVDAMPVALARAARQEYMLNIRQW